MTNFKKTIKLELTLEELHYVTEMCENDLIDFEDKIENKLYDNEMYTDEDYEDLKLQLEICKKVQSKLVSIYNENLHGLKKKTKESLHYETQLRRTLRLLRKHE